MRCMLKSIAPLLNAGAAVSSTPLQTHVEGLRTLEAPDQKSARMLHAL
jgi:hypothetical protein